jgi:hypothetical protein
MTIIITVVGWTKGVKVAYEVKDSIFLDRYKEIVSIRNTRIKHRHRSNDENLKNEIKIYFDKSVNMQTNAICRIYWILWSGSRLKD